MGETAFIRKALKFVLCALPVWREGQTPEAQLASHRGDAKGALPPEACSGGAGFSQVLIRETSVRVAQALVCSQGPGLQRGRPLASAPSTATASLSSCVYVSVTEESQGMRDTCAPLWRLKMSSSGQ